MRKGTNIQYAHFGGNAQNPVPTITSSGDKLWKTLSPHPAATKNFASKLEDTNILMNLAVARIATGVIEGVQRAMAIPAYMLPKAR